MPHTTVEDRKAPAHPLSARRFKPRTVIALISLPLVTLATTAITATPASADSAWTQHVAGTGGAGLYTHTEAGLGTPINGLLTEGAEIVTDCVAYADTVGGTDPAWLHITSPYDAWVSDYYVDTLWSRDNTLPQQGLPECGSEPLIDDDGSVITEVPTIHATYDRDAAVAWATTHATDIQPVLFAGCTWFVSQALWAGGLPQTLTWNGTSTHGRFGQLPGTVTATAVEDFLVNLRATYPMSEEVPLSPEQFISNAVPEAEIGDIIAYDWESDGSYDHLSLVTNIADGDYPEVSEWGTTNALKLHLSVDYQTRGWTWSANDTTWLQDPARPHPTPNVSALLFHLQEVTSPTF